MNPRYCSFCGHDKPPFEIHHLAAKKNHPHWTVCVCKECHVIATAWQYADRVIVAGTDTKPPLSGQQIHKILTLALARTGELMATRCSMTEYMILFAVFADLEKQDGNLPIPKYRNPAPIPNPAPKHAQERIAAAQLGILAYFTEEQLGFDHPLPALFREIECEPFAWEFDNSPGLATWDFSSPETIRTSILAKLISGFDAWIEDYITRWKHR